MQHQIAKTRMSVGTVAVLGVIAFVLSGCF